MDCVRWHLNSGENFMAEEKKRLRTKELEDLFFSKLWQRKSRKSEGSQQGAKSFLQTRVLRRGVSEGRRKCLPIGEDVTQWVAAAAGGESNCS